MHNITCLSSKKNRNCMGCSSYWKSIQVIPLEEVKPWGTGDLLHYEPEHSETFLGYISMNGSYTGQRREMLSCDAFNTMVNIIIPQHRH